MRMEIDMDVKKFLFDEFNSIKRNKKGCFPCIKVGNYILSIQGSTYSYSTPKENYSNLSKYNKLEIAIFDSKNQWISPRSDEELKYFAWANLFEDDNESPVAGYVTIEQIEEIVKNLLSLFGQSIN